MIFVIVVLEFRDFSLVFSNLYEISNFFDWLDDHKKTNPDLEIGVAIHFVARAAMHVFRGAHAQRTHLDHLVRVL